MTMREETRRNLNRALWMDRLKKVGLGLLIVSGIGAFVIYQNFDLAVTNTSEAGVIERIDPLVGSTSAATAQGLSVGVKLDNGQHVTVIALKSREPKVGDRITVIAHHHGTGRVTHSLK